MTKNLKKQKKRLRQQEKFCQLLKVNIILVERRHSGDSSEKTDEEKEKDEKAVNAMAAFYEYYVAAEKYADSI